MNGILHNRNLQLFILLQMALIAFGVNNGIPDANIMEARNLTTAREILQSGHWLEPTMNGELRLEKPPLPTWITAMVMSLSGEDNLSLLRFPALIMGLLLIFSLYRLTEELTKDRLTSFLASGTAITSFYIFFMARDISWDIFCHSFMFMAIWLLHRGMEDEQPNWKWFAGSGFLMGLSFMSKGPVPFYALLLPYLISRKLYGKKERRREMFGCWTILLVIFLVVSFWWPFLIWVTHPEHASLIIRQETTAWVNRSVKPFYHYWSFTAQSGIWAIMGLVALWDAFGGDKNRPFSRERKLIAGWVLISVVLLSLFPEKKERYLFPVLLPLSISIAFYIRSLVERWNHKVLTHFDRILLKFHVWLMIFISGVIVVVSFFFLPGALSFRLVEAGLIGVIFLGIAIAHFRNLRFLNPFNLWLGMVAIVLAFCLLMIPFVNQRSITNKNFRSYAELRQRSDINGMPFYFNGEIPGKFIEVIWNSGRKIGYWDAREQKSFPVNLPFVLLSHEKAEDILPPDLTSCCTLEVIGHFNSNPSSKEGNIVLDNWVTLIRPLN